MNALPQSQDISQHETATIALPAPEHRPHLRLLTCGSVDDGKSTLIGRLLFETDSVPDDQLANLELLSRRHGTRGEQVDYALLLDGLSAEREQGITIDVAWRYFGTTRTAFIVADSPGHAEYTRNMVTAASHCELAVLLVDARQGLLPQTLRHACIAALLGIQRVVLAVNKMDLIGFDAEATNTVHRHTPFGEATSRMDFPIRHPATLAVSQVREARLLDLHYGISSEEALKRVRTRVVIERAGDAG